MFATEALLRIRRYHAGWSERAALSDGTRVMLRPLGPGDAGRIAAAFARLSKRTRALRFLGGKTEMSPAELRYLSEVDGEMHFALAACLDDAPDEVIGIARFMRFEQDPARAEVAATVSDAFQGRGLGRLLLTRLAEAARERGVRSFHWSWPRGIRPCSASCARRRLGYVPTAAEMASSSWMSRCPPSRAAKDLNVAAGWNRWPAGRQRRSSGGAAGVWRA